MGTTLSPCTLLLHECKHLPHILKKGGRGEDMMDRPGLHFVFLEEHSRKPKKGVFQSAARNLVSLQSTGRTDVFLPP